MTDMPPPYPGINTGGYTPSAHGRKSRVYSFFCILFLIFFYFVADAKAAEAAASGTAYYDPNTHYAYVPPAYVSTPFFFLSM